MLPPVENRIHTDRLFREMGTDCRKNITVIVQHAISVLDSDLAFFIQKKEAAARHRIQVALTRSGIIPEKDILVAESGLFASAFFTAHTDLTNTADTMIHPVLGQDAFVQQYGIRSCLSARFSGSEESSGVLIVCDMRHRSYSPSDIQSLKTLSTALSLEEKRLEAEMNLQNRLKRAEKMELIGIVAGGVAHDLNNILSGLVSYPELLLMQIDKNSPLYDPISFINDAGLKAAEIVQDLLTLTRRSVSQPVVLNLNTVVDSYFNSPAFKRLEENCPGIRFQNTPGPDLLNIKGSESHISKVIMNLIMNAAEAIEDQGDIWIETLNWYVDYPGMGYAGINEGEYVLLRITDTGQGIPESDLERIFEPFYTKKQMGRSGSGLGLSVVWNAVKDHNGYIDVTSEPNRGTTFEIYFPATRGAPHETDSGEFNLNRYKGNQESVLVIDDVKEQRQIARKCLEMIGYTPYSVPSGEKAVEFLQKQSVALLILDMKMEPGIDGLETYRRILEIHPNQKAIIASGFSETSRVKTTLKLGAGQYIRKPYTLKKLAVAIKKELTGIQ